MVQELNRELYYYKNCAIVKNQKITNKKTILEFVLTKAGQKQTNVRNSIEPNMLDQPYCAYILCTSLSNQK